MVKFQLWLKETKASPMKPCVCCWPQHCPDVSYSLYTVFHEGPFAQVSRDCAGKHGTLLVPPSKAHIVPALHSTLHM